VTVHRLLANVLLICVQCLRHLYATQRWYSTRMSDHGTVGPFRADALGTYKRHREIESWKPEDNMKRLFAAMILLAFAVPTVAEIVEFKPAENWESVPDDGSGGPLVLLWAQPRGLGQSGTQFFTPVEVSTSVFSVIPQDLPDVQLVTVPEHNSFAWIFVGLAICGVVRLWRKSQMS
jgi:hypothetical protein